MISHAVPILDNVSLFLKRKKYLLQLLYFLAIVFPFDSLYYEGFLEGGRGEGEGEYICLIIVVPFLCPEIFLWVFLMNYFCTCEHSDLQEKRQAVSLLSQ